MIFTENMCHQATRLQQNTIDITCWTATTVFKVPILCVTPCYCGDQWQGRASLQQAHSHFQQSADIHPFIPSSLDSGDKWSFEQLHLWIEYFKNNSLSNNKRKQLSSVQRMLVACWWSLDVGGVGSGGARERDSDGGCCRGWAGLGLVKAKGKELGQRLSCGSTQQYGAGERSCCSEGSEECLPIFLQHLTITYQTSLDAAVRRLTVKSLIAEEFKFLSRIHLDDLSEWIFSKSECKVWFGACGESENVFMRFKLSFNDLSGPS